LDESPSPSEKWVLTQDAFDRLLAWLDPDRGRAGERYEEIRAELVRRFRQLGCGDPEERANETIDRVAKKLPEIVETYRNDPKPYFFSVAHYIRMEYLKRPVTVPLPQTDFPGADVLRAPEASDDDDDELLDSCLSHCMSHLPQRSRELILQYYQGERQIKIRLRKEMAERLGVKPTNLRLKAQRIRAELKECILDCLARKAAI
jgi:DNA-directed RNA polymerase specialized sigma24 family protein